MEEKRAPERGLAVQRAFAPNRLSEDVLRIVYDRLLEEPVPAQAVDERSEPRARPVVLTLVLTGGPS